MFVAGAAWRVRGPPQGSTASLGGRTTYTWTMSTRAVNTTLFVLVIAQWLTGFGTFLTGTPPGRWTVWLHAAGGFAIAVLFLWKARIIVASLRRRGAGFWAMTSLTLLLLTVASLTTGVLWSTVGLPWLLGSSGLTWHVGLSLLMLPLFWSHAWAPKPQPGPRDYLQRRRFLQRAALVAGGVALWRGTEVLSDAAALPGADRRFTGSRDAGGDGADFPRTSWFFDDPDPVATASWRLTIDGAVTDPLMLRAD